MEIFSNWLAGKVKSILDQVARPTDKRTEANCARTVQFTGPVEMPIQQRTGKHTIASNSL